MHILKVYENILRPSLFNSATIKNHLVSILSSLLQGCATIPTVGTSGMLGTGADLQ